jgi:hypothetical protein
MLEEIVRAYCAAKIQKLHILNKNGADLAYNHQRDIAQKLGLPEDPAKGLGITPYPSPVNNTNTRVDTSSKTSPWATAALVAASVFGGGATTALITNYLNKSEPEVTQPTDPTMGAVDIDVR